MFTKDTIHTQRNPALVHRKRSGRFHFCAWIWGCALLVACTTPGSPPLEMSTPSGSGVENMNPPVAEERETEASRSNETSASMMDVALTADMALQPVADHEQTCAENERRLVPCGLNDRGLIAERCSAGEWLRQDECEDPDNCRDGATESTPCENINAESQTRSCENGQWSEWTECEDIPSPCDQTLCGQDCVDLDNSTAHCGTCGNECADNSACCDGICVPKILGEAPPLARLGRCGTLQYGQYAHLGEAEAVHILPDFSFAGYRMGGVPIPAVPIQMTIGPIEGDNRAHIQAAIDEVSTRTPNASGHRGAVLLTRGEYRIGDTLTIAQSGVVLRGEGQGEDGTILLATKAEQHDLLVIQGEASGFGERAATRAEITSVYVPVGSRTLRHEASMRYALGDTIAVFKTPNQDWIDRLNMAQWGWSDVSYHIGHERRIVGVDDNEITVDIPFVDTIDREYGGGHLFKSDMSRRIEEVGVEDLRIVSTYANETDEDHGWKAIVLSRTTNSWVRRVTVAHFGYAAVSIERESSFNTVEEVAMLDPKSELSGGRRYSFNLVDGVGNLFQRCYARDGRHNFVSGARTTGPNVWLDCLSVRNNSDEGPHHRWATGLLFDNIKSDDINVQNRTSSGTGHGWTGGQVMFWNVEAHRIICDTPETAMNWSVGNVGTPTEGAYAPEERPCFQESPNATVTPRSLYIQQLKDRLGNAAVEAITTQEQRDGRIWDQLSAWAGGGSLADTEVDGDPNRPDPNCERGIRNGNVCCALSCGACGGQGCGRRAGGATSCCGGRIRGNNQRCAATPPPCVMD